MPKLETERLILRPPEAGDAEAIAKGLGDYQVAKNLAAIPHPFVLRDAEAFVAAAAEELAKGEGYSFAIAVKETGALIGGCALHLRDGRYKLNFWLARPFWGQGYASEAAKKLMGFAFHALKAETVWASWFDDNPASGRVLGKLGFKRLYAVPRENLARGVPVLCHRTALAREDFGRKRPSQAAQAPERLAGIAIA
jgi:[ribosomal protein S5]-alanine N-acetyltransferase